MKISQNAVKFDDSFVKVLREAIKITGNQNQFAKKCGINAMTLSLILNKQRYISVPIFNRIMSVLKQYGLNSEPMNLIMPPVPLAEAVDASEIEGQMLAKFRRLSPANQQVVCQIMDNLLSAMEADNVKKEK